MSERDTKVGDSIHLSVVFNTVRIEINCKDEYEAQILFEDIEGRMRNGGQLAVTYGKRALTEQPL